MQDTSEDGFESKLKEEFDKLEKDYDVTEFVLDKAKDSYLCDCGKKFNFGKLCKYPEKYKDGGCK
jgi:hypothetical protein